MKTYCKHVDPTDIKTIEPFVAMAITGKLTRKDYSGFVAGYCNLTPKEIRCYAHEGVWSKEVDKAVTKIAEDISGRILAGELNLEPIRHYERSDGYNQKLRDIGVMSVMQQVMEHVAVGCMDELWRAKFEYHQYASIRGKGQLRGARAIQKWAKQGDVRHFGKLDVKKCFQSIRKKTAMKMLRRDIRKNELLLWFVNELLKMHGECLVIGSLLSQFLCNYFMSYAYRFVMGLGKTRRGKTVRLLTHALFYMDDILLTGTDRRNVLMAARKLVRYMRDELGLTIKSNWHIHKIEHRAIDMMGYVIRADGKLKIRPRVFIRARRAYRRSALGDMRTQMQYRVSAYYGFFKAAGIKILNIRDSRQAAKTVLVAALKEKAGYYVGEDTRRRLQCAA